MLQVLRFSRLFGPGKPSSLPQIWRSVRKRRRRRKQHHLDHSDSGSDQDNQRDKRRGWTFNFAPPPTADMCASDDEVIVNSVILLRFEILMAPNIWDVMLHSIVHWYKHSRGTCCLHLKSNVRSRVRQFLQSICTYVLYYMDFMPKVGNLNAFVLFCCVLLLHFSAAYFPEK